jgi:hypothetical protein
LFIKSMRRKVTDLAQGTATVQLTQDALGRPAIAYAGIPIGVVEDDATGAQILGFDEDDGSGNLDTTSIYALRFGLDAMHGIQTAAIDVRDLGELDAKPVLRTRIEWYPGIVLKHPRCAARLRYINNA